MKKKIIILLSIVLFFTSCNSWFNVTSSDEIREEDHYSTEIGFQQSLIGCYIAMAEDELYGKNLSWYGLERLGHQFYPQIYSNDDEVSFNLQNFSYNSVYLVSFTENIWAKAYNVIANVNEALKYIDEKQSIMDPINYHIIKGELLAIRAYMHFDLLRLYGYGSWEQRSSELNNKYTIPYALEISKEAPAQVTGDEAIRLILTDVTDAANLLREYDPVTKKHDFSYYANVNTDGFYNTRNLRLNYYAVKALESRVRLWEGSESNKSKALDAAEEVIKAIENGIDMIENKQNIYILKFLTPETINSSTYNLTEEQLFGLSIQNLDTKIKGYIKPYYVDDDSKVMYIEPETANQIYENSTTDVRFTTLLDQSLTSSSLGYVPLKVYQPSTINQYYKNKISMIRLPEVYYIAAECCTTGTPANLEKAMTYLNHVRQKRGLYEDLKNLDATQIINEIKKEYRKEFLSEGVMFYYYKRTGSSKIPYRSEIMEDKQYVLPYPTYEIQSGRVQ